MINRGLSVVPPAGTWIEIVINVTRAFKIPLSFPLRERGLKFSMVAASVFGTRSFPLRETWIEIEYFGYGVEGRTQSFPLQQRRLKSLDITPKYAYNNCSPAGTWIEIKLIGGDLSTALGVPLREHGLIL